ncbi:hypothetical protein ACIBTV_26685 [Micromonospora sp. NPDC049366]|uniref:hypothetical protein n=1 Tax=Micromonospora sp. NPDC049366 TaxID=3364271 RepID=UPI0037B5793F
MTAPAVAPEHQVEYDRFWRQHVTIAGQLIDELVARELYDFRRILTETRSVYRALTGVERPDEQPEVILAHAGRIAALVRAGHLRAHAAHVADDDPDAAALRATLHEIAGRWEAQAPPEPRPTVGAPPVWLAAAWYGTDHPDHEVEFRQIWRDYLVGRGGRLDQDKVAQVLHAYSTVIRSVSLVYDDLTASAISKPNTLAHHVIDAAEVQYAGMYADFLCDEANHLDEGPVRAALIALAEQWYPGAWNDHQQGLQVIRALDRQRRNKPQDAAAAAA